ncbi:pantoate--beta-alanine ligase [Tangfeifania diversioriginum]|uniref:Pantothenate synthetase n=1 Tax=Tangfeifania diversioriginum TaxID=1168035 RepID=A0A1M6IKI7_9BACT|nr:pantoate--beta-alanine ligase [Tangfeifania diversioriginum]SHJ35032.1 pantoate--beta-alanine ligase [Tangfeifania diversioriginum]
MKLVKTNNELQEKLAILRKNGAIGFVPTMGALHSGHLSLVEAAMKENNGVVVSIFVNPTQFNDANDLKRYPRNLEADLKMLEPTGCDLVFAPEPDEIYPKPDTRKFDFGEMEQVMEGAHRPGHFNGVAQVVSKLFELVNPDRAYFGQKDFQQVAIINKLVSMLDMDIEIVPCPIVREESGLAMSSRNELLNSEERQNAALIYKTLSAAKKQTHEKSVYELKKWVTETINKNPFLDVEYFEVVDEENLKPVENWSGNTKKVGCIAVFCGQIRLIDNIELTNYANRSL